MTRRAFIRLRDRLDRTGIWLSSLCAVHCALTVILVSVLGVGGQFLFNPVIHELGLALAFVIGAVSLGVGMWRHGRPGPLILGTCGLVLMGIAIAMHHDLREAMVTIAGVTLVALAHIWNLRRPA